jgi:copper chaperone
VVLSTARRSTMTETLTYEVPGVHCAHCEAAIKQEVGGVEGVERVEVDLDAKKISVSGTGLDDATLRAAIGEAGYETVA